jgi:hypothetical protein
MTGVCVLAAVAALPLAKAQVPGGWSEASVKDNGVVDAAQFAVKAQQQAMKAAGKGEKLTLVKILSAQQQVVQGVNYKLTLRIRAGDSVKTAEAEVWARVWLKGDEPYKLTSWKFTDEKESKPAPATNLDAPKPLAKATAETCG